MKRTLQFDQARFRKLAALLGILILGLFATIQVVHAHPLGQTDDSHCSVCLVAHATATLIVLPAVPVLVFIRAEVSPAEAHLPYTVPSAALFIRPLPRLPNHRLAYLLNGDPVEVETMVTVNFTFATG